jgi:chromate reductase
MTTLSEHRPVRVLTVSGSLRTASLNTRLLELARALAPAGLEFEHARNLGALAHFNEDIEHPAPAPVADLRQRVAAADALLIATPEYNASMPGVLKNALDWLSRPGPEGRSLLDGKPVAVIGASMGPFGTVRAQLALRQVLQKVNSRVVAQPEVMVPLAHQVLTADLDPASVPAGLLTRLLRELHDLARVPLPLPV